MYTFKRFSGEIFLKIRLQGISIKTPIIHYIQLILKQHQQQPRLLDSILGKLSVKKKYPEIIKINFTVRQSNTIHSRWPNPSWESL